MAIFDISKADDVAILRALWSSLVDHGNTPAVSTTMINGIFGLDYAQCDYCSKYPANTYDVEGMNWNVCSSCEGTQEAIAFAQLDAMRDDA